MVCPAVVKDPHLGESDVHHCNGGANEVHGVDGVFRAVV